MSRWNGHAWSQHIEGELDSCAGECRIVDLAERLQWGCTETGTQGLDLVAFREFLKSQPQRFELRGPSVLRANEAPCFEMNHETWLPHVRATVEGFGGRCLIADVADKMLWGMPGTETYQHCLRTFLVSHSDSFMVQGLVVSLFPEVKRHLESATLGPAVGAWGARTRFEDFDDQVWAQRIRQAIWLQTRYVTGCCTMQDLCRILNWGSLNSLTYGHSLREFLMINNGLFDVDGFSVSLKNEDGLIIADIDRRALGGFQWAAVDTSDRPHSARPEGREYSQNDAYWLPHIVHAIEQLGGVCSLSDVADMLLWGSPQDGTADVSLRDFIRAHSNRLYLDATLVSVLTPQPASLSGNGDKQKRVGSFGRKLREPPMQPPRRKPQEVANHMEAIVRSHGGTCTTYDLLRKLKWGSAGSGSFGQDFTEFLDAHGEHLTVGGGPTLGASDGESAISVSMRGLSQLEEESLLTRLQDVISRAGGECTTRDICLELEWGRPETSTHGIVLREFLAHHERRFAVTGFSVAMHPDECRSQAAANISTLQRVIDMLDGLGGACQYSELAHHLHWGHHGTGTEGQSLRALLHAHSQIFSLGGNSVKLLGTHMKFGATAPSPDTTAYGWSPGPSRSVTPMPPFTASVSRAETPSFSPPD